MKQFFLIMALAAALVSCHKGQKAEGEAPASTVDKDQAKAEIMALEDDYMVSMNSRKINGISSYYSEDARSYMFGKPVLAGRAAILEGVQKDFAKMPADAKVNIDLKEVLVSNDGKQAVEIGSYKLNAADGNAIDSGHYFGYFEKREGKYVCVREMVTSDAPAKPATQS